MTTYSQTQRTLAARWKQRSPILPSPARRAAAYVGKDGHAASRDYDFCLPRDYAEHNLLPDVRQTAMELFTTVGIPWHSGVDGGPSNHLLSSQVQCVNALAGMVLDPDRVVAAFGALLGVEEVVPIEPGRFLTFEYIGPKDFFGEAGGGVRVRGARCTSVDAAFLHRAVDGATELVLVEWKYTESYRLRAPEPERDEVRAARYSAAVSDPNGPIRDDVLTFEHLLDEPIYQLVRQQLLAHELERMHAEGADRVRVVHVSPAENLGYQRSLPRPEHRALGATVSAAWQALLRHQDRFLSLDSALFLDPAVTSADYVHRYAPDTVFDQVDLLAALRASDADGVENAIDFDGTIELHERAIELIVDGVGTELDYPFTITELHELSGELDPG